MRLICTLALTLACATHAASQTPMTGAEFEAYVNGKTLTYGTPGNPAYGVEMYLPDRRVIWSVGDGQCLNGVWYESKGDICFRYDDDPEPKCWTVTLTPTGIRSVFTTRPTNQVIVEATAGSLPLICDGFTS